MSLIPILFLAVNLALPVWFWTRSGSINSPTTWSAWQKNVARLIEASGGFSPCSTNRIVNELNKLCTTENSDDAPNDYAGRDVIFSCRMDNGLRIVSWRPEVSSFPDLKCTWPKLLASMPTSFVFVSDGRMRAITFRTQEGTEQVVPYRNCRVKANRLKDLNLPESEELFVQAIGKLEQDPIDYQTANRLCLIYDSSPLWDSARQKYRKKN